jgi:hypothetical protein
MAKTKLQAIASSMPRQMLTSCLLNMALYINQLSPAVAGTKHCIASNNARESATTPTSSILEPS